MTSRVCFILFLVLICSSCKQEIKNYHYPTIESFSEEVFDTIIINELKNYEELISKLENLSFRNNQYGFIQLQNENENEIYNILITTRHGPCFPRLIKGRNLLTISEDSILKIDNTFHLDSLTTILQKDINNNGKDKDFSTSSDELKISFALRNYENLPRLENYLIHLIENFNKVNTKGTHKLNLQLDREFFFHRKLFENLPKLE